MPKEIERRWLISEESFTKLSKDGVLDSDNLQSDMYIEQGYLVSDKNTVVRVRIAHEKGFTYSYLTIKAKDGSGGISCLEYEYNIPYDHAVSLMNRCDFTISKRRMTLSYDDVLFELDTFETGNGETFHILEIEFETIQQANDFKPNSILSREITGDSRFSNYAIAKHGYPKTKEG